MVYRIDGFHAQISDSGLISHNLLSIFDEFRVFILTDGPGHFARLKHPGNLFSGISIDILKANNQGLPGIQVS